MTERRARVLIVDDSAFARKVLRDVLLADARVEVVGIARDGLEALEKIAELAPDVLTLDLVMPELDGLGVLAALRERQKGGLSVPKVLAVTMSDAQSELGLAALEAGALDVVHKPTALATDRLYDLRGELIAKIGAAMEAATVASDAPAPPPAPRDAVIATSIGLVVIGTSTGGPQAIGALLRALPAPLPVPIAIVVHMPAGYTESFAARLDGSTPFDVREASEGLELEPGRVVIARAGSHLHVEGLRARLSAAPIGALHRPSVDELFRTAALSFGARALGVVLTGMGNDGLEGARALRAAGARVLVESPETCVVDGMPRSVREAGLATAVVPLHAMARAIVREL